MQKQEKILSEGHGSKKRCKSAFWDRTPPIYTSNLVYMCVGEFRVPNLQAELNCLDLFKSYCNSSNLGFLGSGVWGRLLGGIQGDQL